MIPTEIENMLKYTNSRLPIGTYDKYSFDTWKWSRSSNQIPEEHQELWRALGQWRNCVFPCLTLYGDYGTGKTHLALAIAWARLSGYTCPQDPCVGMFVGEQPQTIFYEVADLLEDLTDFEDKNTHKIMQSVKNCGLLVLDDIGIQKGTEFARSRLDTIINHRYIERKLTILTANSIEPSEKLTPRILDRARDGILVRVKGQSYRGTWKVRKQVCS